MALSSPALTLAIDGLFGNIKPALDIVRRIGATDFSDGAPSISVKPGATLKVPVSSVSAANEYNPSSNNYLTGGDTTWATLTAKHYLKGFDITGVNVDQGCDAARMRQLFTSRAGTGIAMAVKGAVEDALDDTTTSTGVTIAAAGSADATAYMGLGDNISWLDKSTASLVVNGTELAYIKAKFAAINITGTPDELARYMGFNNLVCLPGMTDRICIVPYTSISFIARVPAIVADYREVGVETDGDSGLSVGIVIATDQATNKLVANADLWFGCTVLSSNAGATTAGIINVGTAA